MATAPRRVLVVEDEEAIRSLLDSALAANGYAVRTAPNAEEAMSLSRTETYDTAIVDIKMPGMDGIELSRSLRALDPDLPVILVTAYADIASARDAIRLGAYDYVAKPFDLDELLLNVARAVERRALLDENRAYHRELEARVQQRTHQLCDAMERLQSSFREVQQAHLESIFVLSRVTELNDEYTGNHIRRVSRYCEEMARALKRSTEFIEEITYSSPMHDIGKISVPSEILCKPDRLSPDEFEVVKQHTVSGAKILEGIPFLTMAREIAISHHEKYNGTGYPFGLRGAEIPLCGRIVAVADVFDALISRRPYKEPYSFEKSLDIMSREAGEHFDPQVLGTFLGLADRMREIAIELRDEDEQAEDHAVAATASQSGPGHTG